MHFGLREQGNAELNSVLGELNISTPIGEVVSRNLRFGNNSMEKLTLPIPEQYGYGSYDGKILTFENTGEAIVLLTYEPEDFFRSYGQQITSVEQMQSGRCYGTASIPVQ